MFSVCGGATGASSLTKLSVSFGALETRNVRVIIGKFQMSERNGLYLPYSHRGGSCNRPLTVDGSEDFRQSKGGSLKEGLDDGRNAT